MLTNNYPDASFSLISGLRFKFTVDDKELLFLASAWTGKESILYDGEEISRIQSYKKKTSHNFFINNVAYEVSLTVDSLLKGGCAVYLVKIA